MSPTNDPFSLLMNFSIWPIVKILFCFAISLYVIFAIVVIRQIHLMTETLNGQLELPLKVIGMMHLLGAIVVLFVAIITL